MSVTRDLIHGDAGLPIAHSPSGKTEIGVVHLVRRHNGVGPLRTFLNSYREYGAGISHDLVIMFKAFPDDHVPPEYEEELRGISHSRLFTQDVGHDITSYLAAAKVCNHEYLLFMNSFSVILASDWLAKYYTHAASERVGAVSATGSWGSPANTARVRRLEELGYGSPRRWFKAVLDPFRIWRRVKYWHKVRTFTNQFPPFPNPHLRTNAFMVRRERFTALKADPMLTKTESVMFECGKSSMTRQMSAMNLEMIVVGRNGQGYTKDSWARSHTFRAGGQENLLVADNRTRDFENLDAVKKRSDAFITWGNAIDS